MLFTMGLFWQANAQDRFISGKVIAKEDGLAIPGVTVAVKGTANATSTDAGGNYTIKIFSNAKELIFTGIGLQTNTQAITGSNTMNVTMNSDLVKLNEVRVTALGVEKETRSLGYSTGNIGGNNVVNSREVNVVNAISSKVAGVQVNNSAGTPGASTKILLRGNKSILLDNQPLFVIDGVPIDNTTTNTNARDNPFNANLEQVNYSNRAVDINPADIEDISILKGPAAGALYGSRGANGVVMITTKRAKYGQPTQVTLGSTFSLDEINGIPDLQLKYAQGTGGGRIGGTPNYRPYLPGADGIYNPFDPNTDDIEGSTSSWGPSNSSLGIQPVDNVKNFFQTGVTFTNTVAISSGSAKNAYRLSISRTSQEGIIPNTNFKRFSARLNAQSQLHEKLSVQSNLEFINSGGKRAQQGSNLSGVMLGLLRAPSSFDLGAGSTNANGSQRTYVSFYDNPYWSVYNNLFKDNVNRLIGSLTFNYFPVDWIKIMYRPGTDLFSDVRNVTYAQGSNNDASTLFGQVIENSIFHQQLYQDLLITFDRPLNKKINTTLTVGANTNQIYDQQLYARGRQLAIPNFYNIGNAADLYADETRERVRSAAFFGDFNISYANTIYLGVTARNEYASTFGQNRRSFFYPGTSLSLILTELKPFRDSKFFSYGKLRANYAIAGNAPLAYSSVNTYSKPFFTDGYTNGFSFPYAGQNGYGKNATIGNPNLEPELTKGFEYGAELKFWQDRLTFDLTVYNQTSDNLLLQRPIAYSTGHSFIFENLGQMRNKGVELLMGVVPVRTKNGFEWSIEANYAANRNEVTKLADGIEQVEIEVGFGDPAVFAKVGSPYGAIYGTKWERDASGRLLIGADGLPVAQLTLEEVASAYPDYILGIRNTFTYKNISLTTLFDINQGAEIWNGTMARLNRLGKSIATEDRERTYIIEGVKADGTPNDVAVDAADYFTFYKGDFGATEEAIEEASWVRLRELNLTWTIKPKLKFAKTINISVFGRNLIYWSDFTGIDPENSLTGAGSNYGGINWFNMPNSRSYGASINISF